MAAALAQRTVMTELSVIIPTYNRAERLQACLEALARQTQPFGDFEVIVVVDGSADGTDQMLAGLSLPYRLKMVCQANQGQHLARNNGVTQANGRYYLFIDDDVIAEPQLVAEHLSLHRRQEGVVGIGQITMDIGEADWYTQRFADGWHQHYEQLNQGLRQPAWPDGYGGNLSVSRALFMEVGGFAPDIRRSHDIEFAYRLQQSGATFVYLPQAIGRQVEHKRARELFSDAARSGAAWITLCRRHPAMLPELLGPLGDTSAREALLREIFWRLGLSPWLLAWLGGFLAKTRWGRKWYRFLFTLGYWWGVRQALPDRETWESTVKGIPILMYHAFGQPGERASQFVIPIRQFARQMAWLKRLNYHVLSLEEYLQHRRQHKLPPARSVVLTIDDGYAEIATLIEPILHRYDFPATVFLVSGKIGGRNDWTDDEVLAERPLMTWPAIKAIGYQGIRFGAHTQTHPCLTDIPTAQARAEIAGSKADLERELQNPVTTFAYPYGEYDEQVQALVAEAGFLGGCTVDSGVNSWSVSLTGLRRLEVEGTWSLLRFLLTLRLGGHL
jgi:peptidoglycan/xylan/chitin deacetylase (PgdA/CDA1 family)/glycosyltransferase involved in cell wall biosynthesis